MKFYHKPVLYKETIEGLKIKSDGIYADGTMGGGGHSEGICKNLEKYGTFVGIDRDPAAIEAGEADLKSIFVKSFI